jgi:hypothetical protein
MGNILKKTITAIILIITALPLSIANADNGDTGSQPEEIKEPRQITSCDLLNQSAKTKGLVVTINEEEIGGGPPIQDIGDSRILRCFRVTTCDRTASQEPQTFEECKKKSEYKDSCQPGPETLCQRVQVIVSKTGPALLYTYIGMVYRWAAGIVGIICVVVLIIGGIEVATAGDDQGRIGTAKTRIFQSIAGLVLLFLSALILYTINPNFFVI